MWEQRDQRGGRVEGDATVRSSFLLDDVFPVALALSDTSLRA